MVKLGIIASHRGSNFQAILDACDAGRLKADPVLTISNNSASGALVRAREAGIPTCHLSSVTHPDPAELDLAMVTALADAGVDLVVTAGYMKKLGPETLARFERAIINIHPSLLPRHGGPGMFGMRVHEAVIAAGDAETGVTVHYVDGDYDTGPTICQERIDVRPGETVEELAARVLEVEHRVLVDTLIKLVNKAS